MLRHCEKQQFVSAWFDSAQTGLGNPKPNRLGNAKLEPFSNRFGLNRLSPNRLR